MQRPALLGALLRARRAGGRPAPRIGADLRLRHAAAGHAQPHHRLRHRQGAEGEGRHERAGAADRRRPASSSRWSAAARSRSASPTSWRRRTALDGGLKDLRIIAAAHALRTPFFVRKDSGMLNDRRPQGQARDAWAIPPCATSTRPCARMLATAGLTEADVKPVLVPNVVRSADDFIAGNADMFSFAFGGPKVKRGRRHRRRHPRARDRRERHARGAQDHAVGLSDAGRPGPDLHRRREADEGLQLRQRDDHLTPRCRTSSSTRSSTRWRRTRTTWSRCSRCCANGRRPSATSNTACPIIRAR